MKKTSGNNIDDPLSVEEFREKLLKWSGENPRNLPWKSSRDPYKIWLSEIILQQTRVEQGTPYYLKFTETYPTVFDLAAAPDNAVMKLWEGLGYYSRARNMLTTARQIVSEYNGKFPETFEGLQKLKGIGAYTAAAIASFAYDLPHAVLDGNVFRVLARLYHITEPIDSPTGKKFFQSLAENHLDKVRPADYNQAIMDFGATCCKPKNPDCHKCPFQKKCENFLLKPDYVLPLKSIILIRKVRNFHFLVLTKGNQVAIRKRESNDIWRGLWEFPMIESDKHFSFQEWSTLPELRSLTGTDLPKPENYSGPFKQVLTHQKVTGWFAEYSLPVDFADFNTNDWVWVEKNELRNFAFPKLILTYFEKKVLLLTL